MNSEHHICEQTLMNRDGVFCYTLNTDAACNLLNTYEAFYSCII